MKTRFYMVFMQLNEAEWVPLQYFDGGSAKAWPTRNLAQREGLSLDGIKWEVKELMVLSPGDKDTIEEDLG